MGQDTAQSHVQSIDWRTCQQFQKAACSASGMLIQGVLCMCMCVMI